MLLRPPVLSISQSIWTLNLSRLKHDWVMWEPAYRKRGQTSGYHASFIEVRLEPRKQAFFIIYIHHRTLHRAFHHTLHHAFHHTCISCRFAKPGQSKQDYERLNSSRLCFFKPPSQQCRTHSVLFCFCRSCLPKISRSPKLGYIITSASIIRL